MIDMNTVGVFSINDDSIIPTRGTELSACYDIFACFHDSVVRLRDSSFDLSVMIDDNGRRYVNICPGDTIMVPTGLIFCIPRNHHIKIYSRSGNVAKRGIVVSNQPGIIDCDYTKEVFVLLTNCGDIPRKIYSGDAVAQCELCKDQNINFSVMCKTQLDSFINKISSESSRNGGFGSTGR